MAEIGREHGACVDIQLASVDPDDPEQQTWFLILDDGHRAVVSLYRKDDRVERLELLGEIQPEEAFSVEEVPVRMEDGEALRTLVFRRPGDMEPRPVVVIRTPYFNNYGQFRYERFYKEATNFLDLGYNLVAQAIRGTHGSGGDFLILNPQEIDDGHDTIDWVTSQPFCNGRVATFGISYDGFTAVAAGVRRPPGLRVIVAASYPTNLATDQWHSSGVLSMQTLNYLWHMQTGCGVTRTPGFARRICETVLDEPDLTTYDQLMYGIEIPEWKAIARAYPDPDSPLWSQRQITDRLQEIDTPGYHFAGLGKGIGIDPDSDVSDVVLAFQEIDRGPHRLRHRLYLGAWGHRALADDPRCQRRLEQILAHHLDDTTLAWASEPRVHVESCHESRWLRGDSLPLTDRIRSQRYYFQRVGEKLELAPAQGSSETRSRYTMQPTEINQWKDGSQYLQFETRCDNRLMVLGPVVIELYLEIDVPQLDLMVFIGRVTPDGTEKFFQCRPGNRVRRQGSITLVRLETEPIRGVLEPGDTLEVQISSNVFPSFVRNRHNAPDERYFERFAPAHIALLHDAEHPSSITLSIEDPT